MSRRTSCGPAEARERIDYAREQLTLAEIGHPWPTTAARKASGAAAVGLLATVRPDGPDLAKAVRIALDAKDPMHYATNYLTADRHTAVLRAATALAEAARRMLL